MAVTLPTPRFLPVILLAATLLAACGKKNEPAAGAPAGAPAMPPPEVGVVTVSPSSVGLLKELPGRLEASRVAQVRARVAGIVQERVFREGSDVKAGQLLFRIDPGSYRAAVASAQATVARAQANLTSATALAERYERLVQANAVSKQEYANAVAAQKQAEAEVAAGRAAVETAQINLGYANVTSPISGRIGRALVTEGALVGQGETTPLAVVQQINPLYVNFTQSANELLSLRRALEQGKLQSSGQGGTRVSVLLEDGTQYPEAGRLLFSDLSVDPATGQLTLRAEIPNPRGNLLPGMYVRVRLEQATAPNAVLLPQQAVTRGAQDTVMVVAKDGKVSPRQVTIGEAQGSNWVVLGGLQPGEQVMVDGFQKLRPGAPVKPVPWNDGKPAGAQGAGAKPAAAPAAAASQPASAASARRS